LTFCFSCATTEILSFVESFHTQQTKWSGYEKYRAPLFSPGGLALVPRCWSLELAQALSTTASLVTSN
jgi:hypothetical protein